MDGAPLENFAEDDTWGEQPFGAPMPRAFRLVDAERIAAERLDGAAEGSLKEALATKIVTPEPEAARLAERLQQIVSELPDPEAPQTVAPVPAMMHTVAAMSDASFAWFGAAPPAHAVPCFEEREFADMVPIAPVASIHAAEVVPPRPVAESLIAQQPLDTAREPAPNVSEEAPPEHALPDTVLAHDDHVVGDHAPAAADVDAEDRIADAASEIAMPLPEDPNLEPMVTAYAASARLAADAAAASQALFELQKLLNEQMLEASPELNTAMEAHGLAGLDAIPVAQQPAPDDTDARDTPRAPDPVTDTSLAPPRLIQQVPLRHAAAPPPLPAPMPAPAYAPADMPAADLPKHLQSPDRAPLPHVCTQTRAVVAAGMARQPVTQPASQRVPVRTDRRRAPPRQPHGLSSFDLRGFAAGFVLSGAIGVVLYFVMATG